MVWENGKEVTEMLAVQEGTGGSLSQVQAWLKEPLFLLVIFLLWEEQPVAAFSYEGGPKGRG